MKRLVVTADLHGSYSTWLTLKDMLTPEDALVVAGDLFGTRYPGYGHYDYQPERILEELKDFSNPLYFVYGNCDLSSFSPGYQDSMTFDFMDWKIFLHHGDIYTKQLPSNILSSDINLVIQGHTHVFALENIIKQNSETIIEQFPNYKKYITLLNPGSLSAPRTSFYTYSIISNNRIDIIDIKTGNSLKSVSINQVISK